jgi:hypothetical protein
MTRLVASFASVFVVVGFAAGASAAVTSTAVGRTDAHKMTIELEPVWSCKFNRLEV